MNPKFAGFGPPSRDMIPQRQNQKLRKILMENLDTSNDDEWFAFVDILTDSISRQIRSGMVPGQRDSPPLNDVLWVLTDACYRGKLKEVIHLLSGDHVDVNEFFKVPKLDVQWTPLTSAAMGGQTTLVKILISKYGARVDNPNTRGMTALTAAAFAGFPEICQVLLDHGANIEAPGLRGETALIGAASGGHGTTVDLLMKHGANIEAVDHDGRTALMKAAKFGCTGTVDLLVTRYGADCSVKDKEGMTAQMIAEEEKNDSVAVLIGTLSRCPKVFEARKMLDGLYKKVEAALDLQLEAEAKLDDLMRQLCEEDRKSILERKEKAIAKHIESEDLLVDYQRRLMEAAKRDERNEGGNEEDFDRPLFEEALEIIEKNTKETETEMLSFVSAVQDLDTLLGRLTECKQGLHQQKKEIAMLARRASELLEGVETVLRDQEALTSSAESVDMAENMQIALKRVEEIDSVLRCIQVDGAVSDAKAARVENLEGEACVYSLAKAVRLCDDEVASWATEKKPIADMLQKAETYLETLKSTASRCMGDLDMYFMLLDQVRVEQDEQHSLSSRPGIEVVENETVDADAGSDKMSTLPLRNDGSMREATSGVTAPGGTTAAATGTRASTPVEINGSTSSVVPASAMDTSQVLDLLEIKLDGDTYRKGSLAAGKDKNFQDGKRAARRSHRNWQLTKDTDIEIAAQHEAANKIADLLQKNKI